MTATSRVVSGTQSRQRLSFAAASHGRFLWQSLFGSPLNIGITAVCVLLFALLLPAVLRWSVFTAVWSGPADTCRGPGVGACWAFVAEKLPFLVFGTYPADERWRAAIAILLIFAIGASSVIPAMRSRWFFYAAGVSIAAIIILMGGGIFGLAPVSMQLWSGLPLTLVLAVFSAAFGFPIAIALALGRRSEIPLIRFLCIAFIEIVRGVPLVSILFLSSILLPFFLPEGVNFNSVLRALVALSFFSAAYLAEVIRGGLQGIPQGQSDAAKALGLSYWKMQLLVMLPQALRLALPPLISTLIVLVKDTSLVVIVGLMEFSGAARAAVADPRWLGFYIEAFAFVGMVYFILCKCISLYGQHLEREMKTG